MKTKATKPVKVSKPKPQVPSTPIMKKGGKMKGC